MDYYAYLWPLLRHLPPETAHKLAIRALQSGLLPAAHGLHDSMLHQSLWGLEFPSPVGMAAGFDKNAEAVDGLLAQGFGFVEAGTVTPRPQIGNPQPRLFRLEEDCAVINRMGFNNDGLETFVRNLHHRKRRGIVGVNLGKNKDTEDAAADYLKGLTATYELADYFTINISSPNTPGLRDLQGKAALDALCRALVTERDAQAKALGRTVPLLVKIAPDMDEAGFADVAEVCTGCKVDGIIVSNTTITRPDSLKSAHRGETGGLSGAPLLQPSTDALRILYRLTKGSIPLVGVGGIASAADAYAKIRAGASLVQLYTALVYQGFALVKHIHDGLGEALRRDGFATIKEAVGADTL